MELRSLNQRQRNSSSETDDRNSSSDDDRNSSSDDDQKILFQLSFLFYAAVIQTGATVTDTDCHRHQSDTDCHRHLQQSTTKQQQHPHRSIRIDRSAPIKLLPLSQKRITYTTLSHY